MDVHRVQIVTAAYDPNPPETDHRGAPAPVGYTYLQLLLRFEGTPEDRGVEPPHAPGVLQIDYPECNEAYDRDSSHVSTCLSPLHSSIPDTTDYQTEQQLQSGSSYGHDDVFEPGVPYFATYYYTVNEELLPTDPQLCYIPGPFKIGEDTVPEGCVTIGEIES